MKTKLLTAVLLFTGTAIFAQVPDKAKLNRYFDALEKNNKFMGTISLSKDGKNVHTRSMGYLDADKKIPVNETTKFRIGSISKTFTAAMVFKAIEDKKLTLDTKLDRFYPAIPNASKITIAQLLNHHSGIHNFTSDPGFQSWYTSPKGEAEMISVITKGGSDFEPGSKADYSNSNYVLLSYILEKTYKDTYKNLVDKIIVKPLKLKNTYYGSAINTGSNEAHSYKFQGEWVREKDTDMSIPMGAGAMVSNPNDLSRFIEGLFAGKIISVPSLNQMKTLSDGYGMGLFEFPLTGKKAFGHNGGIDGFTSLLIYVPEEKITFALTSNGANYDNDLIAKAAVSWMQNTEFSIPDFSSYAYKGEDLDRYLGTYSSAEIPLKITVTKNGTSLLAQATGQSAFPLDAGPLHSFKFERAGIEMEFAPEQKEMVLKQNGAEYHFKRD